MSAEESSVPLTINSGIAESNEVNLEINKEIVTAVKKHKKMLKKKRKRGSKQIKGKIFRTSPSILALHSGKFDMEQMREAAAHWIMMHEHPFTILDEEGFNLMIRRGIPEWQKISKTTCRADYPTKKMLAVEFCFPKLHSELDASKHISKVKEIINSLYEKYVVEETNKGTPHPSESESFGSSSVKRNQQSSVYSWDDFDDYCAKVETSETKRFELVDYLEKGRLKKNEIPKKISCLEWWKMNRMQYPILSKITADILAIPVSSVASEATFSAGMRRSGIVCGLIRSSNEVANLFRRLYKEVVVKQDERGYIWSVLKEVNERGGAADHEYGAWRAYLDHKPFCSRSFSAIVLFVIHPAWFRCSQLL
ncbi:hypothetical protein ZIOFF_012860 [Zingiber officinale]|uniref:HAT C-terminal dimerisation domain-containing protein n=1 Tax=Zingiber officinale TaxID=94328 RepID=A0A8J5HL67_ZINOF|nr:hypothetical protein ZIOFF_012860 [Zingiber officinale]